MKMQLLIAAAILFAGCRVLPEPQNVNHETADKSYALTMGEKIVDAIITGNYRNFAACTGEEIGIKDQKEFDFSRQQIEKNMGNFHSWRFLGTLQTPLLINQIYAVKFIRKGSYGTQVEHEQLLQLVIGHQDNQYKLVGMRFI